MLFALFAIVIFSTPSAWAGCVDQDLRGALQLSDLRHRLASQLKEELKLSFDPILTDPPTQPTSGADLFLISSPAGGDPIAVAKVFHEHPEDLEREVAALGFMKSLKPARSHSPEVLLTGTVKSTGEKLMVSTYAGVDLERLVYLSKSGDQTIWRAIDKAGSGLPELHAKGPHLPSDHPAVKEYVEYEVGKLRKLIADLKADGPLRSRLMERAQASPQDLEAFQRKFEQAAAEYEKAGVKNPSIAHGDAHPGNLAYRNAADDLAIFDAPALMIFRDGHGDPIADVGRFSAGLMVAAIDARIPIDEARKMQEVFVSKYLAAAGQSLEANRAALEFHQLRFYGVVLSETTRSRLKISDATRARLIRFLREEFRPK